MAKTDERLFAPFPIEMDEHPKIAPLSDKAFRALFEATFYSRRMMSDGFLDDRIVLKRWGLKVADELSSNDPNRPSWIPVDGGWQIHDFGKHHPMRADIEAKREAVRARRIEAGRRGGVAKAKQTASKPVANESTSVANPSSETETETETVKKKTLVQPTVEHLRDFEMFWEMFPRKQGKADALKAYTAVRKKVDAKTILAGAQAYALLNIGEDKSFLKMAGGWLRGERWADEQIVNATRQTVTGSNDRFCDIHPDYPVSARYPCEACTRSVGLSDGREF